MTLSLWLIWLSIAAAMTVLGFVLGWYLSSLGSDDDEQDDPGVFVDEGWSAQTERQLIAVMPYAMIVLTGQGLVQYLSPDAQRLNIVEHGRLNAPELEDILAQVTSDGRQREREIHLPARPSRADSTASAGSNDTPRDVGEFIRVRIGRIDEDMYAMFLSDISEQRRFESVRRDFVTNVSHELKTPAGAISLLAETIADAADDPKAVRYFAQRMVKESQRLTQLVYRLIDLQRAQNLATTKVLAALPIIGVVKDSIAMNLTQAQAKHVALHLVNAGVRVAMDEDVPGGPAAKADRESLTTAVKNLIDNAIRYSPEHSTVTVDVGREHGQVLIRVIDNGIGIPKESLDRIFERFYRVDAGRSRDTGGSGLGLAIAKHCVTECGGSLSVWSHRNLGSTFTIALPEADESEAAAADTAGASVSEQRNGADDDANSDR